MRKKREKRVRMRVIREERTKNMGEKMTGTRDSLREEVPEASRTMATNIFKNLQDHFQIPDHIPIRLPGKFEKCYSGKITDVGMYEAMFVAGLRLPWTALHHQLANFLGLSVSQITPNAWRIFIRAKILWGRLSGGNCQLSLDEFFWCYRP